MTQGLQIRDDVSAEELRRLARRESGRKAARMIAIAAALDGVSRADAARLAGMERQALRDAVVRYNAEGLSGLEDRPKGRAPRKMTPPQEEALIRAVLEGPDPEADGVCAWTREDLCRWLKRNHDVTYHPASLGRILRRLGLSRQKARPYNPKRDLETQEAFKKGASQPS